MSVICLHAKGKLEAAVVVEKKKKRKKKEKKRRRRLDAKKECQFLSNILLFVYCLGRGRIEFNTILCL